MNCTDKCSTMRCLLYRAYNKRSSINRTDTMNGLKTLNECFIEACQTHKKKDVKALIRLGCDINCEDAKYQYTGLMRCAGPDFDMDIMDIVLQTEGVDVNRITDNCATANALQVACFYNKIQALDKLVSIPGLHVNSRNKEGDTAVLISARIPK